MKVGGVDVRDYNLDVLRHEVSMVLQKNVLFSRHHPGQPALGRRERHARKSACRMAELACADEFIERFPDKLQYLD